MVFKINLPHPCYHAIITVTALFTLISDEESHMDVHDRALLYYRLLKTNVKEVMTDRFSLVNKAVEIRICERLSRSVSQSLRHVNILLTG